MSADPRRVPRSLVAPYRWGMKSEFSLSTHTYLPTSWRIPRFPTSSSTGSIKSISNATAVSESPRRRCHAGTGPEGLRTQVMFTWARRQDRVPRECVLSSLDVISTDAAELPEPPSWRPHQPSAKMISHVFLLRPLMVGAATFARMLGRVRNAQSPLSAREATVVCLVVILVVAGGAAVRLVAGVPSRRCQPGPSAGLHPVLHRGTHSQ